MRIAILDNTVHHILKSYEALRAEYPDTELFSHESEMYEHLENNHLDLLLLNLDLAPNDAVHLVQEIRNMTTLPVQPLLVVYSMEQDDLLQEVVLDKGADALIHFHRKPLMLRLFVRNLLSRKKKREEKRKTRFVIDVEGHVVYSNGRQIDLPRKEFLILMLLFSNRRRFVGKKEIASAIWHDEKVASKRTIDVHVYNVRHLLCPELIISRKGCGYRLNDQIITM